ncbi:MAG: AAA family ATPase [Methylotenera sp.]|nr:AAA family ATPase [Methylotenera sp.]
MITIHKLILKNFKKFENYQIIFNKDLNIIIGDNEAGKSTILEAIDLLLSGSLSKLYNLGIENIFNVNAIDKFWNGSKNYSTLPTLQIEVFLSLESNLNSDLNGTNHSDKNGKDLDGLVLTVKPDEDFSDEITRIIDSGTNNFPFEFYVSEFSTFSGKTFNNYKKYVQHLLIDSSEINTDYAAREYIKRVFNIHTDVVERSKIQNEFRQQRRSFANKFEELNKRLNDYKFILKTDSKSTVESNITLSSGNIPIELHGKGKQAIIKTEFAITRSPKRTLDLILLEEPENHLSHINTRKLIHTVSEAKDKQIFIATHSSLIATRLQLNKAILIGNTASKESTNLSMLPDDTSVFFLKAPNHKVLEFIISKKVILVEGDAEYILMGEFYRLVTGNTLDQDQVNVIEVGGKCFKRYLDLAKLVSSIKVAVLTDNDGNHQLNIVKNYEKYSSLNNVAIFADSNNSQTTFEKTIYENNIPICESLFSSGRRTLSVQEYMLSNKTEAAFEIAINSQIENMKLPEYVIEAIQWIKG